MSDGQRIYTISDGHWTGISCSCCNAIRAKRKKKQATKPVQQDNK